MTHSDKLVKHPSFSSFSTCPRFPKENYGNYDCLVFMEILLLAQLIVFWEPDNGWHKAGRCTKHGDPMHFTHKIQIFRISRIIFRV